MMLSSHSYTAILLYSTNTTLPYLHPTDNTAILQNLKQISFHSASVKCVLFLPEQLDAVLFCVFGKTYNLLFLFEVV